MDSVELAEHDINVVPAHLDVHQRMCVDGNWTKQQRVLEISGCLPCTLLFHSPWEMRKKPAVTLPRLLS